ncbi:MAG: YitT family protein [Lachnospiraceae bacterium]|nr:YitT family protein [Lachnospiraceae bacterium]
MVFHRVVDRIKIEIPRLILILLGSLLYSAGIGLFLEPNSLTSGGVMGISIILSHTVGLSTGQWYFVLNIPLIIIGLYKFGADFISHTFIAIFLNSLFTDCFRSFRLAGLDLIPTVVIGSLLVGAGLGTVIRAGATTGGMDIVVKLLRTRYPAMKTSTLFILVDVLVVAASGVVFGSYNLAIYSFIAILLNGRVMDFILYGNDEARLVYIISTKPKELLSHILNDVAIGATLLSGTGAYSNSHRDIIMCVVRKRRAPRLQTLVRNLDPDAFMIITSANEIYGEGYKNIRSDSM